MAHPVHRPAAVGVAALDELPRVPWRDLAFAYTYRERSSMTYDIEATLRAFRYPQWDAPLHAIYSNVTHQGTVYEATAYAVPFLVALAAGPELRPRQRRALISLLADIALSASFDTEDGGRAGAYGDGVGDHLRETLATSRFDALAALEPDHAPLFAAIHALVTAPSRERFDAVRELERAVDAARDATADDAPRPVIGTRYRSARYGDATLVREEGELLVVRCEDGQERSMRPHLLEIVDLP